MAKKKEDTAPDADEPSLREDQYEVLLANIRRIEDNLASIDRDLEHDRQDLQDFKVRLGTLEGEVKQLREAVNIMGGRIKDKVADVVEPIQTEVQELREVVDKKKFIRYKDNNSKLKKFFKRLKSRVR